LVIPVAILFLLIRGSPYRLNRILTWTSSVSCFMAMISKATSKRSSRRATFGSNGAFEQCRVCSIPDKNSARSRACPVQRIAPGLEGRDALGRQYEGLARVDSAYQTAIIVTLGSTVHFKRTRNVTAGEGNKFVRRARVDENDCMRVLAFVPVRRNKYVFCIG